MESRLQAYDRTGLWLNQKWLFCLPLAQLAKSRHLSCFPVPLHGRLPFASQAGNSLGHPNFIHRLLIFVCFFLTRACNMSLWPKSWFFQKSEQTLGQHDIMEFLINIEILSSTKTGCSLKMVKGNNSAQLLPIMPQQIP